MRVYLIRRIGTKSGFVYSSGGKGVFHSASAAKSAYVRCHQIKRFKDQDVVECVAFNLSEVEGTIV